MKKLILALVLVFAFTLTALANPFVDVPLNHWAYDAVQSLSAKGIIVGYPDGTFGGAKSLTRYEFAEAVAKALAYVEGMDFAAADDVVVLEKLAIEFADELASLGVTVADLEAALGANTEAIAALEETVAKHETFFEPIKITGRFRATYEDDYFGNPAYTGATLKDNTRLYLVATINDKTTAGVTLDASNTLGAKEAAINARDFFIDFVDGEYFSKLRVGDIASADVGKLGVLGTVFDDEYTGVSPSEDAGTVDATEKFEGIWAKWSMLEGEWTGIGEVDQFYTVKGQFDNFGAFVSLDKASPTKPAGQLMDVIAGADLDYTFDDEVTNLKLDAAYQVFSAGYGGKAQLTTKLGDEDEIGVTLAGYYATAAFAPTATDLTTGKYEGSAAVSYLFDFEDFEATTGTLKYTYRAITATNAVDKSEIKATMEFTIEGTETAKLEGSYRLDTGNIVAYGDYLNYPFDDDEEWKLSAIAKYNLLGWDGSGAAEYYGILTLDHAYSDTTSFQLEGRWDSFPAAGAPNYSAYAEVKHTLAENTTLKVYYELNDWDVDEDWATTIGVNDGIGTLWSRLEVTF